MAETVSHALPLEPPYFDDSNARPPQGTVTAHGTLAVYEPGSGKPVGEVRVSTPAEVREAVASARLAPREWSVRPLRQRAAILLGFQQLLLERAAAAGDLIGRENGKPKGESLFLGGRS